MNHEQMENARYRIACNFGVRAGLSPIAYIVLLISLAIATDEGWSYFQQYWYLELLLLILTIGRMFFIKKLVHSEKHNYTFYLNNYYLLSLCAAFVWNVIISMMLWADQLQSFSYLMLSLNVATTAGAIGTMSSYVRTITQFIIIKWTPMLVCLFIMTYLNVQDASLILFMVILMLGFVFSQGRSIALENQTSFLRQIQLEIRSDELSHAIKTIEKQQDEVKKHRDHLQEMVDEKTIDLIEAKEKAEQADRSKSEFLANMSHELRTPLHSILSFSQFGLTRLGQVDEAKIRDYFEKINYSGEIQLNLVNDLLDLSRMEFKKEALFFQNYNLLKITDRVIEELSSLYEEKSISISLNKPDEVAIVNGDENKIAQLLRNLLGNAIKFSPENSQIFIRIYKSSHNIRLEIEDQGMGVPDEDKESIFDKFSQSSRTRTGAGGTGLGLAICAQIMQLHKGDIWVEDANDNEVNSGAIFIVIFPQS
ncbi:MAG: ATP-binding protein [Gammaproteobacteria bacterium]|nr:ATP-binding protein [Gammaproteobacteria bacterium]